MNWHGYRVAMRGHNVEVDGTSTRFADVHATIDERIEELPPA